jgi:hypothetical protein
MKSLYFLLFIICIFFQPGFSQLGELKQRIDDDKNNYEEFLRSELGMDMEEEQDSLDLLHWYYLIPEQMPEWFFKPDQYASSSDFFIGISDPGMDSAKAFDLAILRAKALLILSNNAIIDNISDNFNVTREDRKEISSDAHYLDFSEIYTYKSDIDFDIHVDKKFYTKNNEAVVLVSANFKEKQVVDTTAVKGEIMQLSREDKFGLENTVYCKFNVFNAIEDSVEDFCHYTFKGEGRRFNVISKYNEDSLAFPMHPYRYVSEEEIQYDTTQAPITLSLSTGLWNAYVNLLFSEINFFNRKLNSTVKSSNDNYTVLNQGIIRTVSRNSINFKLGLLYINDNELGMDIYFNP